MSPSRSLVALVCFVAASIVQLWPIASHLTSRILDDGDSLLNAASLGSTMRLLLSRPFHVFDMNMYYPFRLSLATFDHQLSNAVLAAPMIFALDSPVAGFNALIIVGFVLAGYGTFRLTRELTGSASAGLLAGVLYAFSPLRTGNLMHSQVLAGFWLPFVLLAVHRFIERPGWRTLAPAVALYLAEAYASWYCATIAAVGVLVIAAFELARRRQPWRPVFRLAAVGIVVVGAAVVPLALPYIWLPQTFSAQAPRSWELPSTESAPSDPAASSVEARRPSFGVLWQNSASFESYLAPAPMTGIWTGLLGRFSTIEGNDFLGIIGLVCATVGLITGYTFTSSVTRGLTLGVSGAALAAATAAGLGHADSVLVTVVRESRVLLIGFGLVLALSWLGLRRSARPSPRTTYLALAIVGWMLSLGPTLYAFRTPIGPGIYPATLPPFSLLRAPARFGDLWSLGAAVLAGFGLAWLLARIRKVPLRLVVLAVVLIGANVELFGWAARSGLSVPRVPTAYHLLEEQPEGAVVEFPIHGNGWSVYWAWFHRRPLVNGFGTTEPTDYARLKEADHLSPAMVEHLRAFFHPRYVVLNTLLYDRPHLEAVLANIERNGDRLHLLSKARGYNIYQLEDVSRGPMIVRTYPRWMFEGKRGVSANAAIGAARADQQPALTVWVNGSQVGTMAAAALKASHRLSVNLPGVAAGVANVEFSSDYTIDPSSPRPTIGRTGRTSPADISVSDDGVRTSIRVNGRLWLGQKGYTIGVLGGGGDMDQILNFNTSWSEEASHQLARYISQIPEGRVVVVASRFDVSRLLTADAVAALHTLGLAADLRGRFQWTHAGIGVKGAAAGTAVEAFSGGESVCRVGDPAPPELTISDVQLH